jgi:hypothetical protein
MLSILFDRKIRQVNYIEMTAMDDSAIVSRAAPLKDVSTSTE